MTAAPLTDVRRGRFWDAGLTALVLCAAYAVKRHYSTAASTQLGWVLAPTTSMVELLTRERFALEPTSGYVSTALHTTITPACAGVNHLIITAVTVTIAFVGRVRTRGGKCAWVVASAAAAYASTLIANATRITIGIALHESAFGDGWVTPATIHRTEGVIVYLGSLWISCLAAEGALARLASAHTGGTTTRTGA